MSNFRIQKKAVVVAVAHAAQATFSTAGVSLNGVLWGFKVKSGPVDGSATITLNILGEDSEVVYTKAAIASNTTAFTNLTGDTRVPLSGTYTVQIVFSANQTATDNTVTVTLLTDRG